MARQAEKTCAACGRLFAPRRKWRRVWDEVRYCSSSCRRRRPGPVDRALERAILELLAGRPRGESICPSEAARSVRAKDWRPLLEPARRAARRLANDGRIEITQGSKRVDPGRFRGPVRLRLTP